MKNKRMITAWNRIEPDETARQRMLGKILAASRSGKQKQPTNEFDRENMMKKTIGLKHSFRTAVIVAIILALATTTVFATNMFGIKDYFLPIFGGAEQEMSAEEFANLEAAGKTENHAVTAVTSNGTTMTPTAEAAEGNAYYLALRVDAPEGFVFDQNGEYYQVFGDGGEEERVSLTHPDGTRVGDGAGEGGGWELSVMWEDDDPTDNRITLILEILGHGNTVFDDGDLKILTIPGIWKQSPDKIYTKLLEGEWQFEIGAQADGA